MFHIKSSEKILLHAYNIYLYLNVSVFYWKCEIYNKKVPYLIHFEMFSFLQRSNIYGNLFFHRLLYIIAFQL